MNGSRSVVDVGMELLRASGAFVEPVEDDDDELEEPEEATEAQVLGALVAQVQAMMDRLAIDGRMERLEAMLVQQAQVLASLTELVSLPRRRVPVRDEAGVITEVIDVLVLPEGPA